jgi:hypothetical protein
VATNGQLFYTPHVSFLSHTPSQVWVSQNYHSPILLDTETYQLISLANVYRIFMRPLSARAALYKPTLLRFW